MCSIINENLCARSSRQQTKILAALMKGVKIDKLGYTHAPLTILPFYMAVVDLLHLFLRITDRLEDLFFNILFVADGDDRESADLDKKPLLKRYFDKLKYDFGISSPCYA
jgi:hypothetical protein